MGEYETAFANEVEQFVDEVVGLPMPAGLQDDHPLGSELMKRRILLLEYLAPRSSRVLIPRRVFAGKLVDGYSSRCRAIPLPFQ
jgi:hypothetical protein